jgi:hypothetical protein
LDRYNGSHSGERQLLNERDNHYSHYKKLVKMNLQENIEKTHEYKILSKNFPHIAESIRLKKDNEKLKQELKTMKRRSDILQQKRKMNAIKTKIRRENLLKRLYGEYQKETRFNMRLKFDISKEYISSLRNSLRKGYSGFRSFDRTLSKLLSKRLPPVISDLGSLDMAEKGLAIREWVKRR